MHPTSATAAAHDGPVPQAPAPAVTLPDVAVEPTSTGAARIDEPVDGTLRAAEPAGGSRLALLCTCTSLWAAASAFALEPMVARQLLPKAGGSAAVWTTTVLFFQMVLLAGYAFANRAARARRLRRAADAQLLLVLAGAALLPLRLRSAGAVPEGSPVGWLIGTLALSAGLPFIALATTSPFVQHVFAGSGHPRAADPYFLYAASNAGSLAGLLAYPLLVERHLGLAAQRRWWSAAYAVFVGCSVALWVHVRRRSNADDTSARVEAQPTAPRPGAVAFGRWAAWAAVPASVSLGATSHLTTDVAPLPLIWVLSLALYLVSYVVAFGRRVPARAVVDTLAVATVAAAAATTVGESASIVLVVACHLAAVFAVGLAFHTRVAASRPHPTHLGAFYLALSVGGIAGSLVNAVIAPLLFRRQLEYPLALATAVAVLGGRNRRAPAAAHADAPAHTCTAGERLSIAARPLVADVAAGVLLAVLTVLYVRHRTPGPVMALCLAAAAAAAVSALRRPRVAVGLVAALAVMALRDATVGAITFRRSFYGAMHVDLVDGMHQLVHGTTTHGYQFVDAARRDEPTSYYSRSGPLGQVFARALDASATRPRTIGVLGLGTGTTAAYLRAGDRVTYYEIDREVVRIASDPELFRYVPDRREAVSIVLGDGRRSIERSVQRFDLLVIDAFSSDAIPTHLITTEAVRSYRRHLAPGGVLAVHVSNRYLDLEPVVGAIARDLRLASVAGHHAVTAEEEAAGGASSDWILLAESDATIAGLRTLPDFARTRTSPSVRAWTDDRSDLLAILIR